VFLNRLLIFLICGDECVKMANFVSFMDDVRRYGWLSFFCMLRLKFVRRWMGMCVVACRQFDAFPFLVLLYVTDGK